jgi:hypothetical protein
MSSRNASASGLRIGDEPAKGGEDRTAVARVRIEECGHAAQEVGGGGGSLGAAEGGREDAEGCGIGGRAVSGGEESGGGARAEGHQQGFRRATHDSGSWMAQIPTKYIILFITPNQDLVTDHHRRLALAHPTLTLLFLHLCSSTANIQEKQGIRTHCLGWRPDS